MTVIKRLLLRKNILLAISFFKNSNQETVEQAYKMG